MANRIPIGSLVRTQAIINRYFVKAKKNLGQNFLIDQNAILGIIDAADIHEGDQVIEIGPGIGSLTEQLLLHGAKVCAYEVDSSLPEILNNELPAKIGDASLKERFKLILKDVLKADFKNDIGDFFDFDKEIKVVANLPYYITTPIIFALAESDLKFDSLTLMMQKEVAERLEAKPGTKAFGPLSIAVQTEMNVKVALSVSHNSFMPKPKVDSSVVVLTPLANKPEIEDRKHFNWIVKMCFSQRRKTLNNNLKNLIPDAQKRADLIAGLGVDPKIRPESLSISQFIKIAKTIPAMKNI
ncbi:MAG: 16S rRNA (adenine(1518)-N(6)/adenine(1519)-N(6))-dimethyltransferase RsmA [Candidatus Lactobacillus pullistercoris]|uniref:Ribosomal RNA small subunit methyltransferase A n=1 Tax=Candidatus Lactobacillus pullistercoris TaxID=2838636 RepID=A0A9E2NU29_9LACO|nr:16S rRNA (adenine(1518)-N(6)/adenine(1519)-N(6))-dimethyltransferase RsmA [Candidatus Lactobacillus pullistercoris]